MSIEYGQVQHCTLTMTWFYSSRICFYSSFNYGNTSSSYVHQYPSLLGNSYHTLSLSSIVEFVQISLLDHIFSDAFSLVTWIPENVFHFLMHSLHSGCLCGSLSLNLHDIIMSTTNSLLSVCVILFSMSSTFQCKIHSRLPWRSSLILMRSD